MRTIALLYHDVVPAGGFWSSGFQSPDADIYKLSLGEFERHLAAIADGTTVPLADAHSLRSGTGPDPAVLITFDDGGASASEHIAGMLEDRGWRGTFLMTTDRIGTRGFMDVAALRDLHRRGHVVGSHSVTHPPRMSACPPAQLNREWTDSRKRLEDIIGSGIDVGSVPGGYYSAGVGAAAARAGYRVLFTSEPVTRTHRLDGCLIVGRFGVQQGVPPEWTAAIVRGDMVPRAARYLHWNGKKALKKVGGDAWLAARRAIIAARRRG